LALKAEADARKKNQGATLTNTTSKSLGATTSKPGQSFARKMADPPTRLLKELDIEAIYDRLSPKSQKKVTGYVYLPCGRGGQHLMTDIEIDELIAQINRNDLLDLLTVEKGSVAKIMIESLDLTTPHEIMYKEEHVRELVKDLETDYYERYEFEDLQKMILEDRRLRMNFWISKITKKPI
jgi:hypothetical protein